MGIIIHRCSGPVGRYASDRLMWRETCCFYFILVLTYNTIISHFPLPKGNLEIVKLLIEKGKVTTDDECLSLARDENHNEVVEFLLKHGDLYSSLQNDMDAIMEKACREGDISKVRQLLDEEKVDLDKWRDDDGKFLAFSPIYLAVRHGHMDLIQLFAERGIQVDMTDGAVPEAPEVAAE